MSRNSAQRRKSPAAPVTDSIATARAAGLRYVTDEGPGIRRQRAGKGFRYIGIDGQPVRDREVLKRIKALVIPPAWTDVWICSLPNGHLQATGRDAKGRKQYRYHPRWREARDETKYGRMIAFGQALPKIRERVEGDLRLPGLSRQKVLATVVRLLESTFIRVGNEEYARENGSFGLTTMRNKHVEVEGATLRFQFRGKRGIRHAIDLNDRRLAKIVKRCQDLPGHELFQYINDGGECQAIGSADVNEYLREATGEDFTAKDFRTWAGTVLAALALLGIEPFDGETQAKTNLTQAIEAVAARLGNTPAICRKCYMHPAVMEAYLDGSLLSALGQKVEPELAAPLHELRSEEAAILRFLKSREQVQQAAA